MAFSRGRSSFHGRLKEVAGVSVDNFTEDNVKSRAFFLSHCHTDHMQGLHTPEIQCALQKTPSIKIYMSEHSAAIIRFAASDNFGSISDEINNAIQVLKLGTSHITLPACGDFKEEYVTVQVIPAGHCLGAVMFLFSTSRNQNILYTGDFRISENDVGKFAQLHNNGVPITIDVLYMDTTFIDKQYTYFPKRTESMDEMTRYIKEWLGKGEEHRVALSFPANYGYEYVIMELSQRLNLKIFTWKWELYRNMNFIESAVTNDKTRTKVHECRIAWETQLHESCGVGYIGEPTLFIRLSAMKWKNYEKIFNSSLEVISDTRLNVCFSTHCSSSEIKAFVHYYQPKQIVGFPNDYDIGVETSGDGNAEPVPVTPKRTPRKSPKNSPFIKKTKLVDEKEDVRVLKRLFS